MKPGRVLNRLPGWSAIAAVIVLVVFFLFFLAWQGLVEGESSGAQGVTQMTGAEFRALSIGESRDEIENALRKGDSAHEFFFGGTGTAVEPMDATCVYYAYAGRQGPDDLVQLCYRDDELTSKGTFSTAVAP